MQTLYKRWFLVSKTTWEEFGQLQTSSVKSKKLKFDGLLLSKKYVPLAETYTVDLTNITFNYLCEKIHQISYVILETISHFSRHNSSLFKVYIFRLELKLTKFLMSFFKQKASFLSKFCVMRNNSSLLFIAETLSAINERNTSKCTFLDFCLLTWKLTKFLMSFFKQKVSYFSKFCIMRDNSSVLFIAEILLPIDKRVLLKSKFSNFQLLAWKLTKFLISFLKPPVSFSLNIA